MFLWELRYRTGKGLDNVQIETVGPTEEEARELAQKYLNTLASPAVTFVYVRPIIVARSSEYPDLVKRFTPKPGSPVKPPKPVGVDDDEHSEPAAPERAPRASAPAGRVGS